MTSLQKISHIFKEYKKIKGMIEVYGGRTMSFHTYFIMKWKELDI